MTTTAGTEVVLDASLVRWKTNKYNNSRRKYTLQLPQLKQYRCGQFFPPRMVYIYTHTPGIFVRCIFSYEPQVQDKCPIINTSCEISIFIHTRYVRIDHSGRISIQCISCATTQTRKKIFRHDHHRTTGWRVTRWRKTKKHRTTRSHINLVHSRRTSIRCTSCARK